MSTPRPRLLVLAVAAALLGGCAFADNTLMPALSGEDADAAQGTGGLPQSSPGVSVASTTAATTTAAATKPGDKIAGLRADLQRLQGDIAQHTSELTEVKGQLDKIASTVDGLAGGIETRLKSTNVPNDPQLSRDFSQAQMQLDRAGGGLARLNNIASWGQSDGALASYILQAARAAESDAATSGPDRRQLAEIESDANRAAAAVDQLVTQTSGEIASRNLYFAAAHRRLAALGPDIGAGARTASREPAPAHAAPTGRPTAAAAPAAGATEGRRALVTIRFDRPDVAYEEQLYGAVKAALARRPDVAFDVVAVTRPGRADATASERNVASVVHSLSSMGLPGDRFRLSAATLPDASGDEVRIYVR